MADVPDAVPHSNTGLWSKTMTRRKFNKSRAGGKVRSGTDDHTPQKQEKIIYTKYLTLPDPAILLFSKARRADVR